MQNKVSRFYFFRSMNKLFRFLVKSILFSAIGFRAKKRGWIISLINSFWKDGTIWFFLDWTWFFGLVGFVWFFFFGCWINTVKMQSFKGSFYFFRQLCLILRQLVRIGDSLEISLSLRSENKRAAFTSGSFQQLVSAPKSGLFYF